MRCLPLGAHACDVPLVLSPHRFSLEQLQNPCAVLQTSVLRLRTSVLQTPVVRTLVLPCAPDPCAPDPCALPVPPPRAAADARRIAQFQMTLAGLEPAIFGSEDQRLIH